MKGGTPAERDPRRGMGRQAAGGAALSRVYDIDTEGKNLKAAQASEKYERLSEGHGEGTEASRGAEFDAAMNLEFERATELRDRLYQLKEKLFGVALPTEV